MSAQLATVEPRPRSVTLDMADRYGMEPAAFEATIRATCIKPTRDGRQATREEFAAFMLVAKHYDLNPLTKEIHAFVAKGGGIVPVVGVDGWSNLVNRNPAFDGMEFADALDAKGNLSAVTCRMFRKDRARSIEATEYMVECKRETDVWKTWPRRMLRHKAMIQAARYAFGFAGIYDPDEAERIVNDPAEKPIKSVTMGIAQQAPAIARHAPAAPPEIVDADVVERAPAPPPRNAATIIRQDDQNSSVAESAPPIQEADEAGGAPEVDAPPAKKPAAPSPSDPEAFHAWAVAKLKEAKSVEELTGIWDAYVEINAEEIFPPDYEALVSEFRSLRKVLSS